MTYWLGRLLIKVPYLGMANLLLPDNPPYQEFIQFEATAENLSKEIEGMLVNDNESEGLEMFPQVKKYFRVLRN